MVSCWKRGKAPYSPKSQSMTKMRPFVRSPSRNGCEVWGPQLHLVPAFTGQLLAHAFPPEDSPAARCGVPR